MMAAFLKPSAHSEPVEGQSEANFFFSPVIPAKAGIQHETSDGLDSHLHGNDESFKNTAHSEPVEGRAGASSSISAVIPAKAGIQHEEGAAL